MDQTARNAAREAMKMRWSDAEGIGNTAVHNYPQRHLARPAKALQVGALRCAVPR